MRWNGAAWDEFLDAMMRRRELIERGGCAPFLTDPFTTDAREESETEMFRMDVFDDADNAADAQAAMQRANRAIGGTRPLAQRVKEKEDAEEEQSDSPEIAQAEMVKANRAPWRSKGAKK